MYRTLIFSDLHWSTYSSIIRKRGAKYSVRLNKLIDTMNWIESLADEYNVNSIISCGDTFDTSSLSAEEITALHEINFSKRDHIFLVGNHESSVSSLEYSSTHVLNDSNSNIISEPMTIEISDKVDFTFIPYITGEVPSVRSFIKNPLKKNVVFAHQELAGLKYGKFVSQSGFDINDILENCTVFINGHLHNEQLLCNNRIVIAGNTCGQNFNEDASQYRHLVYLLTVDDDGVITLDPIENPHSFNFYKIRIDTEEDLKKLSSLKNNAVVSVFCNDKLKDKAVSMLESLTTITEYKLTITYEQSNFDGSIDCFKIDDHFKLFIEFAQNKFEKTPALEDELSRLGGTRDEITL